MANYLIHQRKPLVTYSVQDMSPSYSTRHTSKVNQKIVSLSSSSVDGNGGPCTQIPLDRNLIDKYEDDNYDNEIDLIVQLVGYREKTANDFIPNPPTVQRIHRNLIMESFFMDKVFQSSVDKSQKK